jgi:hypothetical protein
MTKNPDSKNQKKLYVLMFILIAALVGIIIVSLIFSYKASKSQTSTPTNPATKEETKSENKNEEEIDTLNWKTYTNNNYEVKIPAEWKIIELPEKNYLGLGKTDDKLLIEFNTLDNPLEYSPKRWLESKNIDFTILEEMTNNGLPALKVSEKLRMGDIPVTIYIAKNNKLYSISCASDQPEDLKIFDQIINNFKLK